MSGPESSNTRAGGSEWEQMREFLWGGPDSDRPGLVYLVERNAEVIAELAETTKKHAEDLYGNGAGGVCQKVDQHEKFVNRFQDNQKWTMRLVGAQLLAILIGGGWLVIRAAISGG